MPDSEFIWAPCGKSKQHAICKNRIFCLDSSSENPNYLGVVFKRAACLSSSRSKRMDQLTASRIHYKAVRERLAAEDPSLDEQTLADTVEGGTDLHENLQGGLRGAPSGGARRLG